MSAVTDHIEGVVIGLFLGFDDDSPLVVYPGNPGEVAMPARSLTQLSSEMIGAEVALLFQDGDPARPLIIGKLVDSARQKASSLVVKDGDFVRIVGRERLELRCGNSVIILEKDGRITIRGTYVTSHARAANRIRGGSVNLN